MHETGPMLDNLPLQLVYDLAQLRSLLAQSVHDVQFGHCNSPSQNIKVQDGSRPTLPLRTRAWWQLLHDAEHLAHQPNLGGGGLVPLSMAVLDGQGRMDQLPNQDAEDLQWLALVRPYENLVGAVG